MKQDTMNSMWENSYLFDGSASYLETLFEQYLANPTDIPQQWRECFDHLPKQNGSQDVSHEAIRNYFRDLAKQPRGATSVGGGDVEHVRKQTQVMNLINAYRSAGHHHANLDPIGITKRLSMPNLELGYHGLSEADLNVSFNTGTVMSAENAPLKAIIEALQKTYCGDIGLEYMHISNTEEVKWIQQCFESSQSQPTYTAEEKKHLIHMLTAAEGLEKYLGTRYVGQKRFSLEGGESLIPALDRIIQKAGANGVKEMVLGMAHRGRLNVLINVLGKSPEELFQEFEGKYAETEHSGDVKYHMGFSSDVSTPGGIVHLALSFNPSHLEIINPVVEGSVRARQERHEDTQRELALPILIHGDAAFAGQGVVMEILNMSHARGFSTGGSVHIIVNNQIGFTTSNPLDSRSTLYCSDVAKMVQSPVFHVNADNPEAVIFAAEMALAYRMKFHKDVVLDMVCYRRHGHNEADEPSGTQPMMYKAIKKHPTTRKIYADKLVAEKTLSDNEPRAMADDYRDLLDKGDSVVKLVQNPENKFALDWSPYTGHDWRTPVESNVSMAEIKRLGEKLTTIPDDIKLQAQVKKELQSRQKMAKGEQDLNWGFAETLAYATLVNSGIPVRLCGQDSQRGTFSHRQCVVHDQNDGRVYIPLKNLNDTQANFTVIDSILSEEAVLGFEYGYATAFPGSLVIWEAQFGDFANGAQVVIDQFISSGEQKWGRLCGLVMLLPHGYEGQGPEHSSARLERYLQLCAQNNMQVCVPSTPAQAYHMLRRQNLRPYRKPLIVMSPKSVLRHKLAVSSLTDLVDGHFHVVIPEIDDIKTKEVERVVLCSGKVYYDLLERRRKEKLNNVVIIRIEQQYPVADKEIQAVLKQYKHAKQVVWCQEEPKNQGAWYFMHHHLTSCLQGKQTLSYAGRDHSAAPATGSPKAHARQQNALVEQALLPS